MFGARPVATQMLMKLCMETMLPTPQHMILPARSLARRLIRIHSKVIRNSTARIGRKAKAQMENEREQ